ncbi:hypothetical protein HDV04_004895 [Boothiomyces sp. JEL0838]|nr:hypothetical protein HDV04_004895 [Boothiomyces sp. JEL0838]
MNIIIYVYYRIVTFYLDQKKHKTKKLSDREKQLIRKALIICSAFILCWIPISVTIVYQEITLQPVNSNVDALSSLLTTTNAVINPYLLILLDARIKQNVYTMLGIPYENSSLLQTVEGTDYQPSYISSTQVLDNKG